MCLVSISAPTPGELSALGLLRTGHFVYESGHHGDTWLELQSLVAESRRLQALAGRLAELLAPYRAEVVCGPLAGGAFVAHCVAQSLDARFVYARRDVTGTAPRYVLAAELDLAGKRALVVDDAINVGSAVTACVGELAARGCSVTALGSVFVCAPAGEHVGTLLGLPQEFLFKVPTRVWAASDCPHCR
jgi:orotate phosphoribosyltransferase